MFPYLDRHDQRGRVCYKRAKYPACFEVAGGCCFDGSVIGGRSARRYYVGVHVYAHHRTCPITRSKNCLIALLIQQNDNDLLNFVLDVSAFPVSSRLPGSRRSKPRRRSIPISRNYLLLPILRNTTKRSSNTGDVLDTLDLSSRVVKMVRSGGSSYFYWKGNQILPRTA